MDSSEFSGPSGGSSVQFITAGTSNANFGLNYPADYLINENLEVAIPCYIGGSRQAGSNYANLDVFVSYPWSNAGQSTPPDHDVNYNTLGSVWGTAFQRSSKKLFASAFLKRHTSLGPDGLGAIYQIDYSNGGVPTVSTLVDLKAAPFNLNLGIFDESDASRFL